MEKQNILPKISNSILERIENVINKCHVDSKILVAYSGGKDSYFLCMALRELGIDFEPIIFDIGYNIDWTYQIELLKLNQIQVRLLDDSYINKNMNKHDRNIISQYYNMVQTNVKENLTPCTPCYNAKIILLWHYAKISGITKCAFGHHGSDAVTSFLKSLFMYIDRYEQQHQRFDIQEFYNLVERYKPIFALEEKKFKNSDLYQKAEYLIYDGKIGTDEPIRQKCGDLDIIRPLFFILEDEIKKESLIKEKSFLKAECFIKGVRKEGRESPREYIQGRICMDEEMNKNNIKQLLQLIYQNLNKDGSLKYDARRARKTILGSLYEMNLQSCNKI